MIEKKTYDELLSKIKEVASAGDAFYCTQGYHDVGFFAQECVGMCATYDNQNGRYFGDVECVNKTGGEDKGSDWSRVYHFKDHGVHIRVAGSYYSYDGCCFSAWEDSVSEVEPEEKTIIVYVPKKTQ